MSQHYPRRGRNWYSAMGVLFVVVGAIVLVQNLIIWSPEFVVDFMFNGEITNEKVSLGMFAFGGFLILWGFRKKYA
ncbi:hypothetical protein [Candidatus Nitrosotenuis aquarius]|uniref:hypothetical protein n=1 Tax=Candidatus Nitrosotenuis aquarius TaxID=1846278 RepID=UPI000C1E881E|nr:hypothetical protein [Candidatus Nitrosotenuis aquarius]